MSWKLSASATPKYTWRGVYQRIALRPPPESREMVGSYLARLASANGIGSIRALGRLLSNAGLRDCRQSLLVLARLTNAKLDQLHGPYPGCWGEIASPSALSAQDFNHHYMRWCPACLVEGHYLRGAWSLKSAVVCTRHSIWLSDRCPACGERQSMDRVDLLRCTCGARLDSASQDDVPSAVLLLQQAIEAATFGRPTPPGLPVLGAAAWQRLLRYMGQFSEGEEPERPGQVAGLHKLEVAGELLSSVAHLLENWPANFEAHLRLRKDGQTRMASLRKTYGRLYRVIYSNLADAEFQFLRDAFEAHIAKEWPGALNGRNRSLSQKTRAMHPRLTIKQAARQSGISPAVVSHLGRAQVVSVDEFGLQSGRRVRTLPASGLKQLAQLHGSDLTLRRVARSLAIPRHRVRELIDAGVLKPRFIRSEQRSAAWMIPAAQVDSLNDFACRAQENRQGESVSIRHVLQYWRLATGEFAALVLALREDVLLVVGQTGLSARLGDLRLPVDNVRQWLKRWREQAAEDFSVDQIASQLGLKQEVTYQLVRNGLIPSSPVKGRGRRISADAVRSFRERYVSLAELARTAGKAPRRLLTELGAVPVSGPAVDGCRQYFFRRVDLASAQFGDFIAPA